MVPRLLFRYRGLIKITRSRTIFTANSPTNYFVPDVFIFYSSVRRNVSDVIVEPLPSAFRDVRIKLLGSRNSEGEIKISPRVRVVVSAVVRPYLFSFYVRISAESA